MLINKANLCIKRKIVDIIGSNSSVFFMSYFKYPVTSFIIDIAISQPSSPESLTYDIGWSTILFSCRNK